MRAACATARQTRTVTGAAFCWGSGAGALIWPTQEPGLVLSARHPPSCASGPLSSWCDPAPCCPHGVSTDRAHCQPSPEQTLPSPTFVTPPSTIASGTGVCLGLVHYAFQTAVRRGLLPSEAQQSARSVSSSSFGYQGSPSFNFRGLSVRRPPNSEAGFMGRFLSGSSDILWPGVRRGRHGEGVKCRSLNGK